MIRTSIIRGFSDQNLVRPSTADNRGLTVHHNIEKKFLTQFQFLPINLLINPLGYSQIS